MHPKALLEACAELVGQALKLDHPADSVVSRFFRQQHGKNAYGSRERAVLAEKAAASGKPANVVEKIVDSGIKTFFKEDDHIRLQPANPQFDPIRVKYCQVQGIVKGVVRRYGR